VTKENLKLNFRVRNCQSDYAEVLVWLDITEGSSNINELTLNEKMEKLRELRISPTYDYQNNESQKIKDLEKFLKTCDDYYITYDVSIVPGDETANANKESDVVNAIYLIMLLWKFRNDYLKISITVLENAEQQFRFRDFFKWLPEDMAKRINCNCNSKPKTSTHFLPAMLVDEEILALLCSDIKLGDGGNSYFSAEKSSATIYVDLASQILRKRFTPTNVTKGFDLAIEIFHGQKITVLQFLVFAFLYGKNRILKDEKSNKDVKEELIYCVDLSNSISSGVYQALENSVYYTPDHIAFFTLRAHYVNLSNISYAKNQYGYSYKVDERRDKTTTPFGVELIVADINHSDTICTNFSKHLENDKENAFCSESEDSIHAVDELLEVCNELKISHFFASLTECRWDTDVDKAWFNYRIKLPNLHTGLAVLASEIRRCDGAISVNSDVTGHSYDNQYFEQSFNKEMYIEKSIQPERKIPGTQMAIFIPVSRNEQRSSFGVGAQSCGSGYRETYETYAKYINTQLIPLPLTENGNETIFAMLERWRKETDFSGSALKNHFVGLWGNQITRKIYECNTDENNILTIDIAELCASTNIHFNEFGFDSLEVFVRGLMNFVQHSNCHRFLAVINTSNAFVDILRDRFVSASPLTRFNENLQLFIHDSTIVDRPEYRGFVFYGHTFGEMLINQNIIGESRGYRLLSSKEYKDISDKLSITKKELREPVDLMPFDAILDAPQDLINSQEAKLVLHKAMRDIAQRDYNHGNSLGINHMRLGSKIHIDRFYNAAPLFTLSGLADRLAFILLRDLLKDNNNELSGKFLFYGYAEYSKGILNALDSIIKTIKDSKSDHDRAPNLSQLTYKTAIYQHARRSDTTNEASVYVLAHNSGDASLPDAKEVSEYKLVQIIPISTTFTTFDKTLTRLNKVILGDKSTGCSVLSWEQIKNITILWVRNERDELHEPFLEDTLYSIQSEGIESGYWKSSTNFSVTLEKRNLPELREYNEAAPILVSYSFSVPSVWKDPQKCDFCFPEKNKAEERPLFETDVTSTVPSAQYGDYSKFGNESIHKTEEDRREALNNERIKKLKGCVRYGHYERGGKHFQFYVNTVGYFRKVSNEVEEWLKILAASVQKINPQMTILFAPEHLSNIEFPQYVNNYLFNGVATTIFARTDSQFRSNFEVDNRSIKDSIEAFIEDNKIDTSNITKIRESVRLCYVDDTIITASTFYRANGLLRSILPTCMTIEPIVFDECFVLIDRLSKLSKADLLREAQMKFHEFVHIDISSMRTLGDACVCCKLEESYQHLFFNSATERMNTFWAKKLSNSHIRPFDTVDTENVADVTEKAYLRLIATHTVQNRLVRAAENTLGDVAKLFLLESGSLLSEEFNINIQQDRINLYQVLLKVLPRPFISFHAAVKKYIFKFFILLADCILVDSNFQISEVKEDAENDVLKKIKEYAKDIIDYFINDDVALIRFFLDYIAEGLCDLKSNYIMRPDVVKRLAIIISKFKNPDQDEMYFKLATLIKRLTFSFSDETKSLYLENQLLNDNYTIENINGLYNQFLDLLYIENIRVIYEGTQYAEDKEVIKNAYFLNAHESLHMKQHSKLDIISESFQFEKYCEDVTTSSRELYKYIYDEKSRKADHESEAQSSIQKYENLIEKIKTIIEKSLPSAENVGCALLARSKGTHPDFDPIAETKPLNIDMRMDASSCTRQYDKDEQKSLRGYYVQSGIGKHELVIKFGNSASEIKDIYNDFETVSHKGGPRPDQLYHRSLHSIEDVFLYVVFLYDTNIDNKKREYVDNIVTRLILQHRQSLMRMLEADFTSSALFELADNDKLTLFLASGHAETHGDTFLESLLKSANVSNAKGDTRTGLVQLLTFVNFRVALLFRKMVANNKVYSSNLQNIRSSIPVFDGGSQAMSTKRTLGDMLVWCLSWSDSLTEEIERKGANHFNFFFNKFIIEGRDHKPITSEKILGHFKSFNLLGIESSKNFKTLNHGWLFSIIMSCFISACKYSACGKNSYSDEEVLRYFCSTDSATDSITDNRIHVCIYREEGDNQNDASYLVIENKANWFLGDSKPISNTENINLRCELANKRLEYRLSAPTSVLSESGHGFSLAICYYYCKRALEERKACLERKGVERNQTFLGKLEKFAYYEKKQDEINEFVFKVRLPILLLGG